MDNVVAHFHFLRPWWLLAALPAVAMFFTLLNAQRRSSQWTRLIDRRLLPFLLEGTVSRQQKYPLLALLLAWLIGSLALAGPTWERKPQPVTQEQSAMVVLWDMSPSMYAQDIRPSRLVRSRLKLVDLLNARVEGTTALIVYAGDAHVVTPLTDDTRTIKSQLGGLSPAVMPSAGSNPEAALEMAIALLQQTGHAKGKIVFITDGIARGAVATLRTLARQHNYRVSVWGIGSLEGAPIPLPEGGFAKNAGGEIVVAKLDDTQLSDAAVAMRGIYIPFTADNADITSLLHFSGERADAQHADAIRLFDQWLEQGHWLVLLILPIAALAFRRGWLLCLALGVSSPQDSFAVTWQDLWQTRDQQGHQLLDKNQAEAAAETFNDDTWRAVANYRAKNFAAASEHFEQGENAEDKYNLGNALAHQGEYDQAIAAYEQALALNPELSEAAHNKGIAEQLKTLRDMQQQSAQGNSPQGQKGDQQNSQDGSQSDNNQGEQGSDRQQANNRAQENAEQEAGQNDHPSEQQGAGEAQRQALDKEYGQPEGTDEDSAAEQRPAQRGEQASDQTEGEQEATAQVQLSEQEMEQQQTLEQWLRRVPDDPSGLLRNKFRYEHQQRLRQSRSRALQQPNTVDEERW